MPNLIRLAAVALIVVSGADTSSKRMPDGRHWTTDNLNVDVSESYCYGDSEANCRRYGRLYTWDAARRGCQALGDGWRLPTDDEWRRLAEYYGGIYEDDAKKNGQAAFTALLSGGESGLNLLLGGNRDVGTGQYARMEAHGLYWTATEADPAKAALYNFGKGSRALYRHPAGNKQMAGSVRCVRD